MKYSIDKTVKGYNGEMEGKVGDLTGKILSRLQERHVYDTSFTHKTGAPNFGSYYVKHESIRDLISEYSEIISLGANFHLCEKVPQNAPIAVHFNLSRSNVPNGGVIDGDMIQLVDDEIMFAMVKTIIDVIVDTIDKTSIEDSDLDGVILKSEPYLTSDITQNGNVQDGIQQKFEIRFPKCLVNHKILVNCIISTLKRYICSLENPFSKFGVTSDIENIILDAPESVPYYGSVIEGERPLSVYTAWRFSDGNIRMSDPTEIIEEINVEYPDGTSIPIPSSEDRLACLEYVIYALSNLRMSRKANLHIYKATGSTKVGMKESEIKDLLRNTAEVASLLSSRRARCKSTWIEVGRMIHSINSASREALNIWIDFSKKAGDAYVPGGCESLWIDFSGKKYEFQTLCDLAEEDSPVEFADWKLNYYRDMYAEVYASPTPATEWSVAQLVTSYRGGKTVYTGDYWYNFEKGYWIKYRKDEFLTMFIMNVILVEFKKLLKFLNMSSLDNAFNVQDLEMDEGVDNLDNPYLEGEFEDEVEMEDAPENFQMLYTPFKARSETLTSYKARCKKNLMDVIKYISRGTFVTKVCAFCKATMLDNRFEDKLDRNGSLLGMNNGVYDLETGRLRKAVPSDYVSLCTGIDYEEFNQNDIKVKEVYKYYSQVFPNANIREYILNLFSTFLEAGNAMKIFQVWSGRGNNGKSVLQIFFEYTLGNYISKAPTQLITSKRINPSAPCPELIALNKARLATCEEPSSSEKIICGVMKQLTGNDTLSVRGLYNSQIMMKPTFSLVLHCNHLPDFDSQDEATWNRVRLIPFESVFNDNAPESYPEQCEKKHFKARANIKGYLQSIASANFWVLSQIYKSARHYTFKTPEEVLNATRQYKSDTDIFGQFVNSTLQRSNNSMANKISQTELYQYFKIWYQRSVSEEKPPKRRDFLTQFKDIWGPCEENTGCYYDITFKSQNGSEID